MKTYRFYILISIALLLSVRANAQQEYTSTNYTHQLSPIKVSLTAAAMENILTPITAGLLVEGQINDMFFYNVHFRQAYLRNFMIPKSKLVTTQKESNGTVFEAGVDWPFSDKILPGKVKVTTESSFDGYSLSEKYFKADCEIRRYWALSGGVLYYKRPEYVNSDSSFYIISEGEEIKAPKDFYTSFNQSTGGIYAGIVKRKIRKVVVTRPGLYNRLYFAKKFYAQALIGRTSVNDIIYNNQTRTVDNIRQMPIGYRIGWQWDENGVVTGFEFGKMPEVELETPVEQSSLNKIFSHNPFLNYMRVTFTFTLFNGDSRYGMK